MKDTELETLLSEALEREKEIVRDTCPFTKLQNIIISHLENFEKNTFDLALYRGLIEYDGQSSKVSEPKVKTDD